ncbi:hypothetical protein, partial [Priestia megaterium]|uniref:hypothetical protein n=1 Tax=Priestia megaterium TaxID=1404 RepID=UPI003008E41C
MGLKVFNIILVMLFFVVVIAGEIKAKVTDTHTASKTVTSNDNTEVKTVIGEKEEEFSSINHDLLSKLRSNNMDKIIKRY